VHQQHSLAAMPQHRRPWREVVTLVQWVGVWVLINGRRKHARLVYGESQGDRNGQGAEVVAEEGHRLRVRAVEELQAEPR
jgi:hypothetical protein